MGWALFVGVRSTDWPSVRRSRISPPATVMTTVHDGRPAGMMASAVASLSLDPVLLLVCINNRLPTHGAIEASRRFAVNVLGEGQEDLAALRATCTRQVCGSSLVSDRELPVLEPAIAHFVCDVDERFPGGDHSIFTEP